MEQIFLISILILSFFGAFILVARKIPVLLSLPNKRTEFFFSRIFKKAKLKILEIRFLKRSFWEIFLQKILSKIRVFSLKIDNLTFNWLKKLREKREKEEKDNFWQKLKK